METISIMSKNNNPVLYVNPNEIFTVKTLDCFSNNIISENDLLKDMNWDEINPASGPIYVNDAIVGDVLKVDILDIKIDNKAVILFEKEDINKYGISSKEKSLFCDIVDRKIMISDDIIIEPIPMIGVIGTAPAGEDVPTTLPGLHGGNMDNTHITKGCSVYLPVFHKGALIALGDLHAIMGDGESTGSGFEISGEVTLRINIVKNKKMPLPMVKTDNLIETIASAKSLDEASATSAKNMFNYLTKVLKIETEVAWKLMAGCGNVEICQFANAIKTARCCIPLKYLMEFNVDL